MGMGDYGTSVQAKGKAIETLEAELLSHGVSLIETKIGHLEPFDSINKTVARKCYH